MEKKTCHVKLSQKKNWSVILIADKVDFKTRLPKIKRLHNVNYYITNKSVNSLRRYNNAKCICI